MHLLVDIGNTRVKYCFVEKTKLGDICYVLLSELSNESMDKLWSNVTAVIYASVNDSYYSTLIDCWASRHGIYCRQVHTEKENFGVLNGYDNYQQLGVDRWLTLVATTLHYPHENAIIVDAGTATTIDVLDSYGNHMGGWILAGIDTMVSSIVNNTANLLVECRDVAELTFGKTTSDNLNIAPWAATIGLIEQAVKLLETQDDSPIKVIMTGGNSNVLSQILSRPCYHHPSLVFDGLNRYIDQKSNNSALSE